MFQAALGGRPPLPRPSQKNKTNKKKALPDNSSMRYGKAVCDPGWHGELTYMKKDPNRKPNPRPHWEGTCEKVADPEHSKPKEGAPDWEHVR